MYPSVSKVNVLVGHLAHNDVIKCGLAGFLFQVLNLATHKCCNKLLPMYCTAYIRKTYIICQLKLPLQLLAYVRPIDHTSKWHVIEQN